MMQPEVPGVLGLGQFPDFDLLDLGLLMDLDALLIRASSLALLLVLIPPF
jgi:hypothetical protein